ncbi:hypothetical protein ACOMHN_053653 [Nucella lapillus]
MDKCCCFVFVVLCVGVLGGFSGVVAISRPSSVVLEHNEYTHLLVAVDDTVSDDPSLVDKIKTTFTKASAFLYVATNHRAVFRDVTILVPASWSNPSNAYSQATSQILNNADVIFTKPIPSAPPPPSTGDGPKVKIDDLEVKVEDLKVKVDDSSRVSVDTHSDVDEEDEGVSLATTTGLVSILPAPPAMTKVYAGCGHRGVRVTLTTDILTDRRLMSSVGPPEKVLVHEWAHFRWGVFDEYALEGEPQFYFSPKTGNLEGVRCTELIQGILHRKNPVTGRNEYCRDMDPNTGLFPAGCSFLPYPAGPTVKGVEASIMDHVSIRPISKFCDDQASNSTRHNYDSPSRHNRLCGHRSTWDVISSSQDFAQGANPSREGVDTAPVFTVVQAQATRRVLLALDTSSSMAEDHKLTRMKQAVATFVQHAAAPATEMGLATFSDTLQMQRAPQALNSSHDRQMFADDLPDIQSGATDITLALTSAAQMFQNSKTSPSPPVPTTSVFPTALDNTSMPTSHHASESHVRPSHKAQNGHVVVVTDGQETAGAKVTSALPLLQEAGVMVSFVVLGSTPRPDLEILARKTGGGIYYDKNDPSSVASIDAFYDVLDTTGASSKASSFQILNRAKGLTSGQSLEGEMYLDRQLGKKTAFVIAYDVTLPSFKVTSPSGRVYSHLYPEYSHNHRLKMAKILIPLTAEWGRWRYRITNPGRYQRVSLLVLSSPSTSSPLPLTFSGMLMSKKDTLPATIYIFAEALRGNKPATGLKVTALINTPGGDTEEVHLFDNGAGADIVENDGVYSRFYSKLQVPGVYTVQLSATGHDKATTGSPTESSTNPNYFVQRSVSAGHIVVWPGGNKTRRAHARSGNDDTEAPVRISDLRVVKTSGRNRTVVLSWRASGGDTDRNTAAYYEVYIAPTAQDLMKGTNHVLSLTQNDVMYGSLINPKPFGTREFYKVRIPHKLPFANHGGFFVFAVVAVDEAGNKGEHSNYVTVGLGKVPDVTDDRLWKIGQFEKVVSPQLKAPQGEKLLIAIILGTVSTLLVLVIVVTLIVSLLTQRQTVKNLNASSSSYAISNCEKGNTANVFAMS